MLNFIHYWVESSISLSILAIVYLAFFRNRTSLQANRWFLLSALLVSLVLPLLHFRIAVREVIVLSPITVTPYPSWLASTSIWGNELSLHLSQKIESSHVLAALYGLGVIFFLGRLVRGIGHIFSLIQGSKVKKYRGLKIVFTPQAGNAFSFFNFLFLHPELKSHPELTRILKHEWAHIRQGHSFDILFLELLLVFQWFNPFVWFLKRAFQENHEYLADREVIVKGIDSFQYKKLLLSQAMGEMPLLSVGFNSSLTKKRIIMLSKKHSTQKGILKYALGLTLIAAIGLMFACEKAESDSGNRNIEVKSVSVQEGSSANEAIQSQPFFIVDEMPEFPGGGLGLRQYIAEHITYPKEAIKKSIAGKVYVSFTVSKTGQVKDAKIAKGVDPQLDAEAIRVIESLPTWKPGKKDGQNADVLYTVPINFALK